MILEAISHKILLLESIEARKFILKYINIAYSKISSFLKKRWHPWDSNFHPNITCRNDPWPPPHITVIPILRFFTNYNCVTFFTLLTPPSRKISEKTNEKSRNYLQTDQRKDQRTDQQTDHWKGRLLRTLLGKTQSPKIMRH